MASLLTVLARHRSLAIDLSTRAGAIRQLSPAELGGVSAQSTGLGVLDSRLGQFLLGDEPDADVVVLDQHPAEEPSHAGEG